MSSQQYLPEDANLGDLIRQMPQQDQDEYNSFGHLRVDAGYVGRIFILYKPTGIGPDNSQGEPDIRGQVRIKDWMCSPSKGSSIVIEDMLTGGLQVVGHTPQRLFDYDVFVAVPPYQRLRYEARSMGDGIQRSLLFSISIKTQVRSKSYAAGVTFCETPKGFRELYPESKTEIRFI